VDKETFDVGGVRRYTSYALSGFLNTAAGRSRVIDGLTFEAMLAPGAKIRRPSDGKTPREVVFVQCAGSRDPEHGVPYCSKVCCMYVAKQATLFEERVPQGRLVFYIDSARQGMTNTSSAR
jgi:heterodisulfide reductase subunit A